MKRIFLTTAVAAAFSASPALAQTFASPTFDNSVGIVQDGNRNFADVDQAVGGQINGRGFADITQNGNRNDARVTQQEAAGGVSGEFANDTAITQAANRTDAVVDQIQDYASRGNNRVRITQRTDKADATVQQRGNRNLAVVRQLGPAFEPTATIQQNGERNTARVTQRSQLGTVNVSQGTYSDVSGHSPDSFQNFAQVDSDGVDPTINVTQTGAQNDAIVTEAGSLGTIDVTTNGSFNTVNVEQYSSNGDIDIFSTAASGINLVNAKQNVGDDSSSINILQSGINGHVFAEQSDTVGGGGNNSILIEQSGFGAFSGDVYSEVTQNGGFNGAEVYQAAASANSVINQIGTSHSSVVNQ